MPTFSDSGVFALDFLPIEKFPAGGTVSILLMEDLDNYYEIYNTDGYGPGTVSKVVNGQIVESVAFAADYSQNINYHVQAIFTPESVRFEVFGQVVTLTGNSAGIFVGTFQVELAQQSAYFDNIFFTRDIPNLAPTAEAGTNQTVSEGQSVILDGSGSVDPDGYIVSYFWQQTVGMAVSFDASAVQPSFTAPQTSGIAQTLGFTLTVMDDSGATASDALLVTVQPQGAASDFYDDFSTDSRFEYTVTDSWTQGGVGQFLYDTAGQRLQVITGNDVALLFEKEMPTSSDSGVFELDFLPTEKFPAGGEVSILLMEDSNNYYEIINTDGYGPGTVSKVVNGQVVDSVALTAGYSQNINYHVQVIFTPESVRFEAFGQVITLTSNSAGIFVETFQIELAQQSAYFDNISFNGDLNSYNSHPIARFQSQLQAGPQPYTVVFDASQSIDPDGTIVQYLWDLGDLQIAEGMLVTHSYASAGSYPVTLTVVDDDGMSSSTMMNVANDVDGYVAIGDSITRGSHDDILTDGFGFEPILAELLNIEKGYLNSVANEGVSGDTSSDGLDLLPTTLANHPEARYVLILYGTNDAFIPVPSGLGLISGESGYAGTFKDNMQRMVTAIEASGKIPYLAKIPFATGNYAHLTPFIEEYNKVVDELVIFNGIGGVSPNLYCLFQTYPEQLSDGVHPNGVGYQSIAQLWLDAFTGQNSGVCF